MPIRPRRGRPLHDDVLTPAEWRVVHAVKHGMTNREIAVRRGISIDAVKYHVANALAKLGLTNRMALRHWHRPPKQGALPESTLYLRVADIAGAHEDLRLRGVQFINAPHLIHRHARGAGLPSTSLLCRSISRKRVFGIPPVRRPQQRGNTTLSGVAAVC